jgi:hypothetical protein
MIEDNVAEIAMAIRRRSQDAMRRTPLKQVIEPNWEEGQPDGG